MRCIKNAFIEINPEEIDFDIVLVGNVMNFIYFSNFPCSIPEIRKSTLVSGVHSID